MARKLKKPSRTVVAAPKPHNLYRETGTNKWEVAVVLFIGAGLLLGLALLK